MTTAPGALYEFGPFRIDPDRELVLRDGEPLAVTPKAFEVLLVLVRRSHETVRKDELLQAVWPGRVVEEANLSQCIFLLRKLLGDTPGERRYIVTLPGQGYRFAADVRTVTRGEPETRAPHDAPGDAIAAAASHGERGDAVAAAAPQGDSADAVALVTPPAEPSPGWSVRKWAVAGVAALIVALALAASAYFVHRRAPPANAVAAAIPAKSIAVLPFQNLSSDKGNEYFVAGMQDLILTKLADVGGLKVIARTSTSGYVSHPEDLQTIRRQLGVATVLEGSVQKQGDQVLINVQLVDTKTDGHIWAQSYTRTLTNVFGVEGDVAEKVAMALKARLSPAETARLASDMSSNDAANNLFLEAEYQANQGQINYDTANWKAAIPLYRQAIAKAPNFALAHARLSYVESDLAWFGGGGLDARQLNADARRNAERALKLSPKLPAAWLALGYFDYHGRGDYDAALKAFAAALKLRPNDAVALAAQGFVQTRQGRFDAAIASFQRATALDPRNSALTLELGTAYMQAGRYPDAERAVRRALALDPHNRVAHAALAHSILLATGDIPRALAAVRGDPSVKLVQVRLLTYEHEYPEALALLDSMPDTSDNFSPGNGGPKALQQAQLHGLMGNLSRARQLYAQVLPQTRTQLAQQQGINLAFVWQNLAAAELGVGNSVQALDAIAKSQAIIARSHDHEYGPVVQERNAALYAQARRPDLAVPLLAKALASPGLGYIYSPVLLWLDPAWDPIRHDPAFQALLKKYAKYKPAVIPAAPVTGAVGAAGEPTGARQHPGAVAGQPIPAKSIAVLPFVNESDDANQQYFSDGLSEDLIVELSQFAGLKVISRDSAFRFRGSTDSSQVIGEKLGVAHLLEGGVQRAGDEVRVSVELVNAADGSIVWSQRYDRPYKDLFALQDDITRAVTDALKAKLLSAPGAVVQSDRPPGGNLAAWNAFLRGQFDLTHGTTAADLHNAIAQFTRATRLDPRYARAFAGIAKSWMLLAGAFQGGVAARNDYAQARTAVQHAVQLDPNLAAAHEARGMLLDRADFDWTGARTEYQRALELAPRSRSAMQSLAAIQATLGHVQSAVKLAKEAMLVEPLSLGGHESLALYYSALGRPDEAQAEMRKVIEIAPMLAMANARLAAIEVQRGDAAAALAAAQRVPPGAWRDYAMAMARQAGPDRPAADAALQRLIERDAVDNAYQIAKVYAVRGDPDNMFKWLDRAWDNRDPGIGFLLYDPFILRYENDPRFAAFCRKVGLPATTDAKAMP